MVMLQIYATNTDLTLGTPSYYNTNLPNGYYVFRLVDIMFDDIEQKEEIHAVYSIDSSTWRIPFGNQSRGNRLLFVNRSNNGRATPQGYYNFLVEIRNQTMDITLLKLTLEDSTFQKMIITFDVTPTNNTDTFVPFI